MLRLTLLALAACASRSPTAATPSDELARSSFTVTSDPGITVAIRAIARGAATKVPVLLVHGAGLGAACFDLPVAGYSLAEDLARAGHPTYAVDVRGWGDSTRPPELAREPFEHPPAVSSDEAVRDIAAAVAAIRSRHRDARVALVGWATGGHWSGMYAARHPDAVARLVLLNTIYGTRAPWALNDSLEDSPGHFSAKIGAFSLRDGRSLVGRWEQSIPGDDKDAWRDPRVAEAYIAAAIASDPTARERQPPTVRVPSGPLRDSHAAASGVMMWVAATISVPVLVVRSGLDFWSRPEDVAALQRDLRRSPARFVTIPEATHFVFLDRPEHGRKMFVDETLAFLGGR